MFRKEDATRRKNIQKNGLMKILFYSGRENKQSQPNQILFSGISYLTEVKKKKKTHKNQYSTKGQKKFREERWQYDKSLDR
jgi:hypothetical protein